MFGINITNDYSNPGYIGSVCRRKRFQFFDNRIRRFKKPVTILDIGGKVDFWVNERYHNRFDVMITLLNKEPETSPYFNILPLQGDACNLSRFRSNTFDIAFSNSLIEHLYSKENQVKMAEEAMRVGRYFFVQTPNLHFPIEPHFKFPFFQYLPKAVKLFLLTQTCLINGIRHKKENATTLVDEIRLLSKTEFHSLFPDSTLYIEYFMGLTKSFIAHNLPEPSINLITETFSESISKMSS